MDAVKTPSGIVSTINFVGLVGGGLYLNGKIGSLNTELDKVKGVTANNHHQIALFQQKIDELLVKFGNLEKDWKRQKKRNLQLELTITKLIKKINLQHDALSSMGVNGTGVNGTEGETLKLGPKLKLNFKSVKNQSSESEASEAEEEETEEEEVKERTRSKGNRGRTRGKNHKRSKQKGKARGKDEDSDSDTFDPSTAF